VPESLRVDAVILSECIAHSRNRSQRSCEIVWRKTVRKTLLLPMLKGYDETNFFWNRQAMSWRRIRCTKKTRRTSKRVRCIHWFCSLVVLKFKLTLKVQYDGDGQLIYDSKY
jgi:hypothetical protein